MFLLALSACADGALTFPTTPEGQRALTDDIDLVVLDPANIGDFTSPARGNRVTNLPSGRQWIYFVGPGDILSVIVFRLQTH
jgi:polysaccharide biosynthesis/export protein